MQRFQEPLNATGLPANSIVLLHQRSLIDRLTPLGLNLLVDRDYSGLKKTLQNDKFEDSSFNPLFEADSFDPEKGRVFVLRKSSKPVATYAYRQIEIQNYIAQMTNYVFEDKDYESFRKISGRAVFSSCAWADSEYQGQGLEVLLDDLGKAHSLATLNWDIYFSNCSQKEHQNYLNKFHYPHSELIFKTSAKSGNSNQEHRHCFLNWIQQNEYLSLIGQEPCLKNNSKTL